VQPHLPGGLQARLSSSVGEMSDGTTHSYGPVSARPARGPFSRLLSPRELHALYCEHFQDRRKERQLLSTSSFFVTFAAVRGVTHAIKAERGPFRNITPGGRHIHHMTFGIVGLLTVGYLWMLEIGVDEHRRRASRITSISYGAGAALTLDEFALWLNLADDYWTKQGRESIDAVALFGSLLALSVLGRGFFVELAQRLREGPEHAREGEYPRAAGG
jgi:hypothetical protein